jgi:uncharacterized protein (DUF433 family)
MVEQFVYRDGKTGRALVAGSDAPVDEIMEALACGQTKGEVLAAYPGLEPEGIAAALRFAAHATGRDPEYPYPSVPSRGVAEPAAVYGAPAGHRPTVAVDEAEYDDLRYRAELFAGLLEAEAELDAGLGRLHGDVFADLLQKHAGR